MKLANYLKLQNLSVAQGAQKCGLGYEAFRLYVAEKRIPRPKAMKKITVATDNKVTAADFYTGADSEAAA